MCPVFKKSLGNHSPSKIQREKFQYNVPALIKETWNEYKYSLPGGQI